MQRQNETTIISHAALATSFTPNVSQPTMPVAVAVLDGPTPPAWDGTGDDPATSFTPGMTQAQREARHATQTHAIWRLTLIVVAIAAIITAILIPILHSAADAQQAALNRYAAQYTGWVSTTADNSTPVAVTIQPCQHAGACTDMQVDITIQDSPNAALDPHVYHLGGRLINDHELSLSGVYNGVSYTADIVADHPIIGNITTGTAQLTLKIGGTGTVYLLRSATLTEQITATSAK